jgi:epoxyqueuosine reductase
MTSENEVTAGCTAASTDVGELKSALGAALTAAGYRFRLAPLSVVQRAGETLEALRREGLLADALYHEYQQSLEFTPPPEVPHPRTLIVVAHPSHAVKARFQLDTGALEATIPPTYISSPIRKRCLEILRSVLEPAGYSSGRATGPVKLLAVKSGLAKYGRNNVAYVVGWGSMVRLDVYATDADLQAQAYVTKGSELLSSCPPCRNCHHHCPTGCIPHAGTVIDASRCLTYLNESEAPFPDWLDPRAHHCLVGCMRCQELCPQNRYYLRKQRVVVEFDRGETEIILENLPPDQLPGPLRDKLAKLDLEDYSTVLGRNLLALRDAGLPG